MSDNSKSQNNGDNPGFDRIKPQPIRPSTVEPLQPETPAPSTATPQPVSNRGIVIAMAVLFAVLLAVVFLLPRLTLAPNPSATPAATTPQPKPEAAEKVTPPAAVPDAEESLAARQQAQEVSEAVDARLTKLEQRAVTRWAAEPWAQLKAKYDKAESAFRQRDYAAAETAWHSALLDAENLLEQSGWELLGANQTGQQGLDEGNSELATSGFELALAIDPDNKVAKTGLLRAERLDRVVELLRKARGFEQEGNLIAARDYYKEALQLDPLTIAAAAGYQRTHGELQDREFRRLISKALAATEAGKFDQARAHYKAATEIRKDAPEVRDGMAAIAVAEQAAAVSGYRREGARLEAKEQWAEALAQYRKALQADSTLAFARSGVERTEVRARLDRELQAIIENPDSLFQDKVQTRAGELLAQANALNPRGPRLRGQIDWLQAALRLATTPVAVTLVSDNRTQVLLYKVGKLGNFERKTLSLKPGDYTVVGRCEGYRDERMQFSIRPNQRTPAPIDIRCREAI